MDSVRALDIKLEFIAVSTPETAGTHGVVP